MWRSRARASRGRCLAVHRASHALPNTFGARIPDPHLLNGGPIRDSISNYRSVRSSPRDSLHLLVEYATTCLFGETVVNVKYSTRPTKAADEKFCRECAAPIKVTASICPNCGARQTALHETGSRHSTAAKRGATKAMAALAVVFVLFGGAWLLYDKKWSAESREEKSRLAAIEVLKNRVRQELKDPSSAEFKIYTIRKDYLCGQVNAKNSLGGYTGFKYFTVEGYSVSFNHDQVASIIGRPFMCPSL